MKKLFALLLVGFMILSFCSCAKYNTNYIEGDLFFDVGASSLNDIDNLTIFNDGQPTEIVLSKEDIQLFEKYTYQEDYQIPELDELFLFPTNKRLMISVNDTTTALYLLEDGAIIAVFPDGTFKAYLAKDKHLITAKKYDSLVKKYTTNQQVK